MKQITIIIMALVLFGACGQSYEETKRITKAERQKRWREDSAALKVAVMPTLDCLPLYVAEYHHLYDTLYGGVRLKPFMAQIDCDTALERGRVEGAVSDLVRCGQMSRRGTKLRYVASTNAYWQLVSNRNARIRELKQLDDKMVAMTRYSVTDMLTDRVADSAKLNRERVFKVQVNDVNVRLLMMQNNMIDALWATEPQATVARQGKNTVIFDSRQQGWQMGVLAFREKEMKRQARQKQLDLFVKAYNQACDSINKYGYGRYRDLIVRHCKVERQVVDSLPMDMKFRYAVGPRQQDMDVAEQWLKKQ